MIFAALVALAAILLDWLLGEPRRWHPLVGFGTLAKQVERRLNHRRKKTHLRLKGIVGLAILLAPFTALAATIPWLPTVLELPTSVFILYLAIGHKSLYDHVRPIETALLSNDVPRARELTGRIVSRDAKTLDIPKAACESVLENGNDSIFAALFWFFVAGPAGVVLYRLSNTLDAMWGYHSKRFQHFGWAAARLDDVLNFIPARLTALSYALAAPMVGANNANTSGSLEKILAALKCWRTQGSLCESPNAGPVMASGAGALGILLGGRARYDGKWHERPFLGIGPPANAHDIGRALRLVSLALALWLVVYFALSLVSESPSLLGKGPSLLSKGISHA